jgi:hypothetical protein
MADVFTVDEVLSEVLKSKGKCSVQDSRVEEDLQLMFWSL